ncbi:MAG: hypothetical protein ACMUIU_17775 [bacterium]
MIKRYPKEEILQEALEALRNNFFIPVHFDMLEARLDRDLYMKADKILQVKANKKQIQFCIEIKNNITRPVIGLLIQYKEKLPHPLLLVTDYVNEYMAYHLKQKEMEFIDIAGNAFINQPPVYIFVKGNRLSEKFKEVSQGNAFRPTGLKAVFIFLCYPDLINKTYREIAHSAGVALGNIGWIINDLKSQGFLIDMGKHGRKLIRKEQLLNWITEYP